MRQCARFFCLFLPFIFILASFVCLVLVATGDISTGQPGFEHSFYFIKFNTQNFVIDGVNVKSKVPNLQDWYTVSLWNYCSGNAGSNAPTFCSKAHTSYWFDPNDVWGLANSAIEALTHIDISDDLHTYKEVAKFTFIAYCIGIVASFLTVIFALFAFCSRIASLFTYILCTIALIFTLAASAAATSMYLVLRDAVRNNLGKYGVQAKTGTPIFVLTWVAAALSIVGGIWYLFAACCCGVNRDHPYRGKNKYRDSDKSSKEALMEEEDRENFMRVPAPYTGASTYASPYARAGTPGSSATQIPQGPSGTAVGARR